MSTRIRLVVTAFLLFHLVNSNDITNTIRCDSKISSTITSTEEDDYLLNISSNQWGTTNNVLNIELITNPLIPIDIYYINSTIYDSCSRQCYFQSVPTTTNYIIRLNRYIFDIDKVLNYTLNINCFVPHISTQIYNTTNQQQQKEEHVREIFTGANFIQKSVTPTL